MRGVRQSAFLFISHAIVFPADVCWASVLQIVKLQSKISMVIDSHHNTPREMTFESARVRKLDPQMESFSPFHAPHGIVSVFQKRDAFCHLLQLMKSKHSKQSEPDVISVFVGTWNMGKLLPPASRGTDAVRFYFIFKTLFGVCRWITPSTCSADLDDVLWFGPHPWWGNRFAPTWHLCCWDSGKSSRGEGMVWTRKGHPPQLYSYWIQTSN